MLISFSVIGVRPIWLETSKFDGRDKNRGQCETDNNYLHGCHISRDRGDTDIALNTGVETELCRSAACSIYLVINVVIN